MQLPPVRASLASFLARWLIRRKRAGLVTLLDPDMFRHANFTAGVTGQMLQQVTLGGAMIALCADNSSDIQAAIERQGFRTLVVKAGNRS